MCSKKMEEVFEFAYSFSLKSSYLCAVNAHQFEAGIGNFTGDLFKLNSLKNAKRKMRNVIKQMIIRLCVGVVCVCVCVCIGGKGLNDYSVMRLVKDFKNHLFALLVSLFPLIMKFDHLSMICFNKSFLRQGNI